MLGNRFLNVVIAFYSVKKRFYSVENLIKKLVGEQDKTYEFFHSVYFRTEIDLKFDLRIYDSPIKHACKVMCNT